MNDICETYWTRLAFFLLNGIVGLVMMRGRVGIWTVRITTLVKLQGVHRCPNFD